MYSNKFAKFCQIKILQWHDKPYILRDQTCRIYGAEFTFKGQVHLRKKFISIEKTQTRIMLENFKIKWKIRKL